MLPSTGYFKNLNCPYFEQDKCERIYCHYRHRKAIEPNSSVYIPTPIRKKSVDAKDVLEYKPTPISKYDKSGEIEEPLKIGKQEIKTELKDDLTDNVKQSEHQETKSVLNDSVYQSIESKLSSIFNSEESSKATYSTGKKEDFSYLTELDKITKETKAQRDQQDKEIVAIAKQPRKTKNVPLVDESDQEINPTAKKARVAHKTGDSVTPSINNLLPKKPPARMSPAQVMFNRFSTQPKDKNETANAESIAATNKKRIAHIPSATKSGSTDAANEPKRPLLPLEIGGKVPNTIRQRYLSLIIDEHLKANVDGDKAEIYQKSLTEEQNIYKRSPSKTSYINLAVIAIKRIRDSAKAKNS